MSREMKKPYVSARLMKKVNEMAESGVKKPIKTWSLFDKNLQRTCGTKTSRKIE